MSAKTLQPAFRRESLA